MPYIPEGNVKKMMEHMQEAGLPSVQALALAQLFDVLYTEPKDSPTPEDNHRPQEGREELADLLLEHRLAGADVNLGQYRSARACSCGVDIIADGHSSDPSIAFMTNAHAKHVAEVLAIREQRLVVTARIDECNRATEPRNGRAVFKVPAVYFRDRSAELKQQLGSNPKEKGGEG